MKRKLLTGIVLASLTLLLTGCCMSHEWQEATCTAPKTCAKCGKSEGEILDHTWVDATCAEPKHCSVCGETEGKALEHTWVEATCAEPKHCEVCGETEGEALEHTLTEANYQQPATCEVCGAIVGEPLEARFEKDGLECNAELDTPYPYTVTCGDNPNYTTTGKVTFSDYEVFQSDETHEALDGYEWQTITVTFIFDDDNARQIGYGIHLNVIDYYSEDFEASSFEEIYTVNYNGVDYNECLQDYEASESGLVENTYTNKFQITARVPEGYDGIVIDAYGDVEDNDGNVTEYLFRLN